MRKSLGVLVMAAVLVPMTSGAGQRPRWLLGSGKTTVEFQRFEAPAGAFSVDYPKKDWQVVAGAGAKTVVFAQTKGEAAVAVDNTPLKTALAPDEITQLFADLEVDNVKQRDTDVKALRTALRTEADGRRVIVLDYTRAGVKGQEQVRQYSLVKGADLFHLICSAAPALFSKYSDVFEHMAETFQSGKAPADAPKSAPEAPKAPSGPANTAAPLAPFRLGATGR